MERTDDHTTTDWTNVLRTELETNAFNGRVGSTLVSETARVRVWHLSLAPGERVGFHRHVNDYFWTVLTEGWSKSRYSTGEVKMTHYRAGDTRHFAFASGEFLLHDLENVGDTRLDFVTVEFLDGPNEPLHV